MNRLRFKQAELALAVGAVLIGYTGLAAASTLSVEATADTFLTNYALQADSDMSSYGAMMISSPQADLVQGISQVRTMENLVSYNSASIKSGFDSQFGAGNWHVTDVQLKWYTNFDVQGVPANNNQFNVPHAGYFGVSYFSNDSWFNPATAGPTGLTVSTPKVTWNSVYNGGAWSSLFSGQQALGTFYYPTGNSNGTTDCVSQQCAPRYWDLSLDATMVADIMAGGYLSFHGYAADDQVVYLVNQLTKPGAHPQIFVSAEAGPAAVPLPGAAWLFIGPALSFLGLAKRKHAAGSVRA
ncbi:hypothetical protein BJL95_02695 [Methylomonas sp. LWB]|uniref:hypothetical protein n=1 Tax=Methylomonas sp. LWB TaxID=1905845 RepID=UPI0008DAD928|nr:hypothetical protein [Methylomonas sp. LWB]OHX35967.1 hypothetical protein BJL95_02695 [Methylomonas sp. LWB]